MIGVVLWSDASENKAVIWCEDHGDLAFYREGNGEGSVALDPGDLVQFDMTMEQQYRFAHNPQLVSEGYHPRLIDALKPEPEPGPVTAVPDGRNSAQIIPFRQVRANRPSVGASVASAPY